MSHSDACDAYQAGQWVAITYGSNAFKCARKVLGHKVETFETWPTLEEARRIAGELNAAHRPNLVAA